mgnify:CR=1 FL=1
MKIFEIIDYENEMSVGVLIYYDKKKDFIIELKDDLDEWTAPLLFTGLIKKRIYTVLRKLSRMWVEERVIPYDRQNIGDILKNHKLEAYDEMKFLELSEGRCSQDHLYIKKINEFPDYVLERQKKTITECVCCEKKRLICFFADDTIKLTDLEKIPDVPGVDKVLKMDSLYESCLVGTGGYFITFNDSIDIPAWLLYEKGEKVPLSKNDFLGFARNNILDTSGCCRLLECSRQNVAYLAKRKYLKPVKEDVKGNLYFKGDVIKNCW